MGCIYIYIFIFLNSMHVQKVVKAKKKKINDAYYSHKYYVIL